MLSMPRKWEEMPPSVKNAIIALLAGWIAHYLFYFGVIAEDQSERVTYLQLGVFICLAFAASLYFLLKKETAQFFSPPGKDSEEQSDDPAHRPQ